MTNSVAHPIIKQSKIRLANTYRLLTLFGNSVSIPVCYSTDNYQPQFPSSVIIISFKFFVFLSSFGVNKVLCFLLFSHCLFPTVFYINIGNDLYIPTGHRVVVRRLTLSVEPRCLGNSTVLDGSVYYK